MNWIQCREAQAGQLPAAVALFRTWSTTLVPYASCSERCRFNTTCTRLLIQANRLRDRKRSDGMTNEDITDQFATGSPY